MNQIYASSFMGGSKSNVSLPVCPITTLSIQLPFVTCDSLILVFTAAFRRKVEPHEKRYGERFCQVGYLYVTGPIDVQQLEGN
jgi:hypothetical protein